MFFKSLVFMALTLNSCAVYTYQLPVVENPQVRQVKDKGLERLREGNVLFVNRSPVWREALVFDGIYSQTDLLTYDGDGYLAFAVSPMGSFEVGPADRPEESSPRYGTKLLGGFYPGQSYTLLIVSKNIANEIVGPPQFYHDRVATEPARDVYSHYEWLGPQGGQRVREPANDVVYLPDRRPREYRGTNTINMNIDINVLLQRGIHRITNP